MMSEIDQYKQDIKEIKEELNRIDEFSKNVDYAYSDAIQKINERVDILMEILNTKMNSLLEPSDTKYDHLDKLYHDLTITVTKLDIDFNKFVNNCLMSMRILYTIMLILCIIAAYFRLH